ncbi:MAG: serine protease [Pyrinomonadaceae bacterium]
MQILQIFCGGNPMRKWMILSLVLVILGCGKASDQNSSASDNRSSENNANSPKSASVGSKQMPAVVLIKCDKKYGSGFLFKDNNQLFLVTAAHLFNEEPKCEVFQFLCYRCKNTIEKTTKDSKDRGDLQIHETRDVAVFGLESMSVNDELKALPVSTIEDVKMAADLQLTQEVFVVGYPVLGKNSFPKGPLIRRGIVSAYDGNELVLDCHILPGNSGGAVFEINQGKYKIIGVVSGIISVNSEPDGPNSGYSIVEPIDSVLTLIDQYRQRKTK